jgi:hypothetical protein
MTVIHLSLNDGKEDTLDLIPNEAGVYVLRCPIFGISELKMDTTDYATAKLRAEYALEWRLQMLNKLIADLEDVRP